MCTVNTSKSIKREEYKAKHREGEKEKGLMCVCVCMCVRESSFTGFKWSELKKLKRDGQKAPTYKKRWKKAINKYKSSLFPLSTIPSILFVYIFTPINKKNSNLFIIQ